MADDLRVECYAGHRGDETPRAFVLGARRVEVAEILDRWLAPDHRYFKLKGDDGDVYILRHDLVTSRWELTLFQARGSDVNRPV
jgi:hypothetical protein